MAALMSAFALSSCLGDSESSSYPKYERMVTVGAGAYILYSDGGEKLVPVNTITGLDKVERAIVAFSLASEELNGTDLESGKTYEVTLDANYCYSVPTSRIIDLSDNAVAEDSLVNSQTGISKVESMYVKNGYLTANLTYPISRYGGKYYIDMAYNNDLDVDIENKTLKLTLYYDNKSNTSDYSMTWPYSFRMPLEAASQFVNLSPTDEIDVVLSYRVGMAEVATATCKMTMADFNTPMY